MSTPQIFLDPDYEVAIIATDSPSAAGHRECARDERQAEAFAARYGYVVGGAWAPSGEGWFRAPLIRPRLLSRPKTVGRSRPQP